MRIIFDWKNFKKEKPEVGRKVIFKSHQWVNNKKRGFDYVFATYLGGKEMARPRGRTEIWYIFDGQRINTRFLSKQTSLSFQIYPAENYLNGFDPYDFEWDYYNEDWEENEIKNYEQWIEENSKI